MGRYGAGLTLGARTIMGLVLHKEGDGNAGRKVVQNKKWLRDRVTTTWNVMATSAIISLSPRTLLWGVNLVLFQSHHANTYWSSESEIIRQTIKFSRWTPMLPPGFACGIAIQLNIKDSPTYSPNVASTDAISLDPLSIRLENQLQQTPT